MSAITVTIKKKQCGPNSAITPEIANKLYAKKGTRVLIISELKSDKTHEALDGDRQVDCTIEDLEVVVDGNLNGEVSETVRRLQRALAINRTRVTAAGDEALPIDDNEPTVEGVLGAAAAMVETDESGQVTGLWDGDPDTKPDAGDEPTPPEDEDLTGDQLADPAYDDAGPADPDDPSYEAHLFEGAGDVCEYADCGQPRTAAVHAEVPAEEPALG